MSLFSCWWGVWVRVSVRVSVRDWVWFWVLVGVWVIGVALKCLVISELRGC